MTTYCRKILFNPRTPSQVENIRTELKQLLEIITNKRCGGNEKVPDEDTREN